MLDRGDRLVIGSYLGPKAVGIYSANYAIAGLLMLVQTPLQITLLPKISALWNSNRASALRYISLSNKLFLTFAIPFVVGLSMISGSFLSRIGNEEITGGGGFLTLLIAGGVMMWGISVMLAQMFYGARRTVAIGVVTVAAALFNLVLNLALVPVWGIKGSAFSTLVSYLLCCVVLFYLSRQTARLDFYWLHILKCIAAALLMAAVLRLMGAWSGGLVVSIVAGGLTYFAAMWVLRAIAAADIEFARGFFRVPVSTRD
jgi:O-antigen/teichoic acid export membrane protein